MSEQPKQAFLNLRMSIPATMKIGDALWSAYVISRSIGASIEMDWMMGITYRVYPDFTGGEINAMIDKASELEKTYDEKIRKRMTDKFAALAEHTKAPTEPKKISLDTLALSELLLSAADTLHAGHTRGMRTILIPEEITLREFMRFCLGQDVIKQEEKPNEQAKQ